MNRFNTEHLTTVNLQPFIKTTWVIASLFSDRPISLKAHENFSSSVQTYTLRSRTRKDWTGVESWNCGETILPVTFESLKFFLKLKELGIRKCKHSIPEEQTKKADDQTASNCKDVGQLHVVGGPAVVMLDRRIGVKAVVHHCVSKITLKRTINPRSGGSPKKAMNDDGRQSFLFPYIRSLHWSV